MSVPSIRIGVFFSPRAELPRGRYALDREAARHAQRERLMAAFTEVVAARGLAGVTVGDVVARAGVSKATFYDSFDDLAACADAAYERFISVLVERVAEALDPTAHWHDFVSGAVRAYLETLQSDLVVARALQIEMDAAGKPARVRRRDALKGLAAIIAARHAQLREENPAMGPLPDEAYLGHVYAVRQLACDVLEDDPNPDLLTLVEPAVTWVAAAVAGAASVQDQTAA